MKKALVHILIFVQLFSSLAWAQEYSTEQTIRQLRTNRQLDLSLYPTVHTYRAACGIDDSVPTSQLPGISEICSTIMQSDFCSGVEANDRLNCRSLQNQPQFNLWDFLSGCASGIMQSIRELLSFIWEIMRWVWNNATSSSARAQT